MTPTTRALAYRVGDLIRDASTRHGAILDADFEGASSMELAVDASWLLCLAGQLRDATAALEEALRADAAADSSAALDGEHPDDYEVCVALGGAPGLHSERHTPHPPHPLDCEPFEGSTVEPLDAPWAWPPPAGGAR